MPATLSSNMTLAKEPLLVFVLGLPCVGKLTLCSALSTRYELDHFSVGDELRSLVSAHSTGPTALIKPKFSASELDPLAKNAKAGTLGPINQTPKYVKERIFPDGAYPNGIRVLIDGFPRNLDRWETFKTSFNDKWQPGARTFAIMLNVERSAAYERFLSHGRERDVFDRRFDEHEKTITRILEAMKRDGVTAVEIDLKEGLTAEKIALALEVSDAWSRAVATYTGEL